MVANSVGLSVGGGDAHNRRRVVRSGVVGACGGGGGCNGTM